MAEWLLTRRFNGANMDGTTLARYHSKLRGMTRVCGGFGRARRFTFCSSVSCGGLCAFEFPVADACVTARHIAPTRHAPGPAHLWRDLPSGGVAIQLVEQHFVVVHPHLQGNACTKDELGKCAVLSVCRNRCPVDGRHWHRQRTSARRLNR